MGNMPHCRFENTVQALDDCFDALNELMDNNGVNEYGEVLSNYEKPNAIRLINMCGEIAEQQGELLEMLDKMREN